jgi:hypothetical protein
VTDYINKISPRLRDNVKDWYNAAASPPRPEGTPKDVPNDAAAAKATECMKLMASLYAEGVPAREVSALNIVFASNPAFNVGAIIKVARDMRADPAVKPWLDYLKQTLLPAKETAASATGAPRNAEDTAAIEAKVKAHTTEAAKLVYESAAIAHTLLNATGLAAKKPDDPELKASTDRYETALGRKLNDDERYA